MVVHKSYTQDVERGSLKRGRANTNPEKCDFVRKRDSSRKVDWTNVDVSKKDTGSVGQGDAVKPM